MSKVIYHMDITNCSSKIIEEFSKQYKIVEASFFGGFSENIHSAIINGLTSMFLDTRSISLSCNFSADIYTDKLEKFNHKAKLNIKMDIPLSDIKINEKVYTCQKDGSRMNFETNLIQTLEVTPKSTEDYDKGGLTSTVTFPSAFPFFENNATPLTFVIYEGHIVSKDNSKNSEKHLDQNYNNKDFYALFSVGRSTYITLKLEELKKIV